MKEYICADLHLNHKSIIKYCPHRIEGRPFPTEGTPEHDAEIDAMNELIIGNWNSKISPDDRVWIVGDVAMGQIKKAPDLIRRLNGSKHLVKGNHDHTLVKLPEFNELFEAVYDYKEIKVTVDGKKIIVVLSHFPFFSWNGKRGDETTSVHLHGHMHSAPDKKHILDGAIMDIGMDGNNLFPYLLEDAVRQSLEHAKINIGQHRHERH